MIRPVDPVVNQEFVSSFLAYMAKSRNYIRTIADLEYLTYGGYSFDQIYYQFMTAKADANVLSTTTGFWQAIYGSFVWSQLNLEANAFGILPKEPWTNSGFRVLTNYATTLGTGGVQEDGLIPDTIKPTIQTVKVTPKTVAHSFSVSQIQQLLSTIANDDAITDTFAFMREYIGTEHVKHINKMLLTDFNTLPGYNFESIDRVCASTAERTAVSYDVGDEDIYNITRSTSSWADAQVLYGTSGTDRDFRIDMLDKIIELTRPFASGGQRVFLTGHDTFELIQQELQVQQMFDVTGQLTLRPSVNGVQVVEPGIPGGFVVTTYRGIPIIVSDDVPKDGSSRIYLLDLGYLRFRVLSPTRYFETGITRKADPFAINRFGDEGVFATIGELVCTNFRAQGKIRDLA